MVLMAELIRYRKRFVCHHVRDRGVRKDLLKVEILFMMLVLALERRDLHRMRSMLV